MAPPNVDNMYTLKVDNVPFDIGCVLAALPSPLVVVAISHCIAFLFPQKRRVARGLFQVRSFLPSFLPSHVVIVVWTSLTLSLVPCRSCRFGEIGDVYIPRARGTNESRGFAFVRFMQKRDAEDAIEGMEGKDFQGRDLRVQFAKQRRPDNPREFYSRGGEEGGFSEERRGGGGYDDRRGGGGDERYGGFGRERRDERRDDYRRSRSPARRESRRHSRSRSPRREERRDGRSSGRERSRSRHRSRSPPRRD